MRPADWWPLLLVVALVPAGPARGFVRSRDPGNGVCLYWPSALATVMLHQDCSPDVSNHSDCVNAVRAGLDAWNGVDCSRFVFDYAGLTDSTQVGFDPDHWNDNVNLIIFQEQSWQHGAKAIALTTTTYDVESGELVDADLEFNGVNFTFTTAGAVPGRTDIQNTATHEAGHMLGLDHSPDPDATMYDEAPPGDTAKRTLAQDDIDGICFVYPRDGKTPPYPDANSSELCSGSGGSGGCCSSAGEVESRATWLAALLLPWWIMRRRRRARGEP